MTDNFPVKNLFVIGILGYVMMEMTMVAEFLLDNQLFMFLSLSTLTLVFTFVISKSLLRFLRWTHIVLRILIKTQTIYSEYPRNNILDCRILFCVWIGQLIIRSDNHRWTNSFWSFICCITALLLLLPLPKCEVSQHCHKELMISSKL